ncbi:DUF99 family protein [Candidatus Bathyarchaeota archaeon]|nr:DUF99 family protein [Candidatus Bathyarchaeota archaeon]
MAHKRFRVIKPEIRILGVDDGVFVPHQEGYALVVGVVFRGGQWLDGVLHTKVEVDGLDATDKIASMILSSPHHKQLRAVFLNGMTFAGFNIVDIKRLSMEIHLPVITVTREKPNLSDIYVALKNLPDCEKRWQIIKSSGEPFEVLANDKKEKIYMQVAGIAKEDAVKILKVTSTRSNIPEPLRVAHLIASGITTT